MSSRARLLPEERQMQEIAIVNDLGWARTSDLSRALRVSTSTILRDLETLNTMVQVRQVHGGA
ncbi:MAG: DeoR family transcriptional regulator, partial [Lacisediminihabitans sp.]